MLSHQRIKEIHRQKGVKGREGNCCLSLFPAFPFSSSKGGATDCSSHGVDETFVCSHFVLNVGQNLRFTID